MAGYPLRFGYCVPIFAQPGGMLFRTPNFENLDARIALKTAQLADELGYDSIWVADHLMLGKDQAILEGWTTLAAIAGSTHKAQLGIIHQAHFFRSPSVTAKMIATLDQISDGRFIYFIDTGTRQSEHHAYGLHYPDQMEDRLPEMIEGLELALQLWNSDDANPVTFDGRFHKVFKAVCTPHPVTDPHPPIWFGEDHPLTLDACAKYGQAWNSVSFGMDILKERLKALDLVCEKTGRDPKDVERTLEIQIMVAKSYDALRESLKAIMARTPAGEPTPQDADYLAFLKGETDALPEFLTRTGLAGTPQDVIAQIQAYVDVGISHFMLWFVDAPDEIGMRLFMDEVRPTFEKGDSGWMFRRH